MSRDIVATLDDSHHSELDMDASPSKRLTRSPKITHLAYIGLCLLCVQQAERALQSAIETVLENPEMKLLEQSDSNRKETLGIFLRKLKRRVNLPPRLKERLYEFLENRNRFIHDYSSIPGAKEKTAEGQEPAKLLVIDLMLTAVSITGLMVAVFQAWARDEHDTEFFEIEDQQTQQLIKMFKTTFGSLAREILTGRTNLNYR